MGLFSNKNKRDRAAEDSGRFYSKDDDAAIGERARAKRASHAGAAAGKNTGASARRSAADPLLPEKKRARRRLVGAIALALAAAVGLPMLLDTGPKPMAGDIAIQIPSKDKAAPLPAPSAPGQGDAAPETAEPAALSSSASTAQATAKAPAAAPSAPAAASRPRSVAAADSIDQGEEIIAAPPPSPKPPKADVRKSEPKPAPEVARAEHKESRPEHKDKPDHPKAETRLAEKAEKAEREDKPVKPKEDKPAKPHEDARALAILEGKGAEARAADAGGGPKSMVQVAAMSSEEKAAEVQAKLRAAGISSSTEKAANGLVRVKIGPYTHDEAEKARAKLARLGL